MTREELLTLARECGLERVQRGKNRESRVLDNIEGLQRFERAIREDERRQCIATATAATQEHNLMRDVIVKRTLLEAIAARVNA